MTREEATKLVHKIRMDIFKNLDTKELTALDMAIEALKAPNGLISKEDVKWQIQEWIAELNEALDMLDSLPSAKPYREDGEV